jgi:dipeptide/tripeptide permease
LVVAALPYYAAMSVAGSVQFHVLDAAGARTASYGSIFALNPVAVVLTSGLLFVLLLVLHLTRARASSLFGIGAGLAIFALGATPLLLARGASASVILLVGSSTVAMAVGEALVGPLLLSRVLGDLPRRFAGLGAALILALSFGASWLANAVAEAWRSGGPLLLSLTAVACLVFGVALLGLAPMMARKLYSPAENPGDPRTASDAS